MEMIGLSHRPKRKPNGITKADREARKSDDLLKRDFSAGKPLEKCVTDRDKTLPLAYPFSPAMSAKPANLMNDYVRCLYLLLMIQSETS